jgi:hypothetical protein
MPSPRARGRPSPVCVMVIRRILAEWCGRVDSKRP